MSPQKDVDLYVATGRDEHSGVDAPSSDPPPPDASQLVLELRDRFWPNQRQRTPGCAPEPEAEFVRKVRGLFLASACVQAFPPKRNFIVAP
jgi:hypothetical protein